MNSSIATADYAIIIGYLLITMVLGLIMTKKASASLDDYFLAGRSMPWWLLGIAGMTGWFDMTGTMIITAFLFMLGPRGLFIEFRGGAVLVVIFLICYTGKWHRRSGCLTGAQWNIFRFGQGNDAQALRLVGVLIGTISCVFMLAYLVRGTSLFMAMMFPFDPTTCALLIIVFSAIYTMASGFYGVVLTDLIQGIIIIVSCFVVSFMAWHAVPDAGSLSAVAKSITGNTRWICSTPDFYTTMPAGYEAYRCLFMFALFYLIRNLLDGSATGGESRYFGARSDKDCAKQSLLQAFTVSFRWPMMMAFAVMGIYLVNNAYPGFMDGKNEQISNVTAIVKQYNPGVKEEHWHDLTSKIEHHPEQYDKAMIAAIESELGSGWQDKISMVSFNGTVNPEQILPAVIMKKLPVGLKGFLLVALIAAMMSTFTGTVNGAAAPIVRDLYLPFIRRNKAGNRELIAASWISTLLVVAVGFWMGVNAKNINSIWTFILMGLTPGFMGPNILKFYWWRLNAWGAFGGAVFGLVGYLLNVTGALAVVLRLCGVSETIVSSEFFQFGYMLFFSLLGTILITLLTRPVDMEVLKNFYRVTRPFGFWGPVRKYFAEDALTFITREHKNDIISLPFAFIWLVTSFLIPMQFIIKNYHSLMCTVPLYLIGVIGLYFFWYKPMEHFDEPEPEMHYSDGTVIGPPMDISKV
ncbi:MAG: sodium:solute symporter [Abditibacteriota bacterium]|nr:sodium:solute symporter [Abditibacteriota bacterium]